jgi:hypothetical protein
MLKGLVLKSLWEELFGMEAYRNALGRMDMVLRITDTHHN